MNALPFDPARLEQIGIALQAAIEPLGQLVNAQELGELSETEAVRSAVPLFRKVIPALYESAALMASMANELQAHVSAADAK